MTIAVNFRIVGKLLSNAGNVAGTEANAAIVASIFCYIPADTGSAAANLAGVTNGFAEGVDAFQPWEEDVHDHPNWRHKDLVLWEKVD